MARLRSHDESTAHGARAAGRPILVIDASEETRSLYGAAIQARGVPVIYAADGREALVQIYREQPRAIVADFRLPYIDAMQLCALIRGDGTTASMHIVVVTSDASSVPKVLARGADHVLMKPVPPDALAEAVCASGVDGRDRNASSSSQFSGARHQAKAHSHERYVTTNPPNVPPALVCPFCDATLQYDRSHVGGVSDRHPEQWDSFVCAAHGVFQYRHRTRKLRHVS